MADDAVRLEGFREFRRDLKRVEPEVAKDMQKDIKAAAGKVAVDASAHAVRGTGPRGGKRHYADTIRPYVTARGASVGSPLPQAGVLHFGGTIRPRGVDIKFPARPVVSEALDRQTDRLVEELGNAIEQAAKRAGWH